MDVEALPKEGNDDEGPAVGGPAPAGSGRGGAQASGTTTVVGSCHPVLSPSARCSAVQSRRQRVHTCQQ